MTEPHRPAGLTGKGQDVGRQDVSTNSADDDQRPSFARSLSLFWVYTLLRFGLFGGLVGLLWLVGVGGFLGAIIALALSVPLSWVLLSRPRQSFAANLEQRVNARGVRRAAFDAELDGVELDRANRGPDGEPGP